MKTHFEHHNRSERIKAGLREHPIIHPDQYVLPKAKFHADTAYKSEFQPKVSQRSAPVRPSSNLGNKTKGSEVKSTTMREDYKCHGVTKRVELAKAPPDNHDRWIDGNIEKSAYQYDYPQKEVQQLYQRPKEQYERPKKPFGGQSTYKTHYQGHKARQKEKNYKPIQSYKAPTTPIKDSTTTKDTYRPWEVPVRSKPLWAEKKVHTNKAPFHKDTVYKDTFKNKPIERVKPASNRAATTIELSSEPDKIYMSTEYDEKFKPNSGYHKTIPKPHNMETIPFEGPMDCGTTYGNDYVEKRAAKVQLTNPALTRPAEDTNWGHPTSYNTVYQETFLGEQNKCAASSLMRSTRESCSLEKNTSDLMHVGERNGHHYYHNRELSSAVDNEKSKQSTSRSEKPLNNQLERTENQKSPAPISRSLKFHEDTIKNSKSSLHQRAGTPVSRDYQKDFMNDELILSREGTQHDASLDEKPSLPLCNCNLNINNNEDNMMENNNNAETKDMMSLSTDSLMSFYSDDSLDHMVVHTIQLEDILEVTSITPESFQFSSN